MGNETVILINGAVSAGIIVAGAFIDKKDVSKPLIGVAVYTTILALFTLIGLGDIANGFSYLLLIIALLYRLPSITGRVL